MSSRTLLARCANRIVNGSPSSQYFSSSSIVSKQLTPSEQKALVVPIAKKSEADFFTPKDTQSHQKALKGYITIESEVNNVGLVSGVPDEHIKTRTVRIYKPPKNAMQSGTDNINFWQISFDTRERWENSLMGWCSSGDPLQALRVNFQTEDEAIDHCKKMGWKYFVQKPNADDPKPRNYGHNFAWNKRTRVTTK